MNTTQKTDKTNRTRACLLALLVASGAAWAQHAGHGSATASGPAPTAPSSAALTSPERPWAEAEIRRVDAAAGKLSLKHGDIKNLDMPPMTMVFQLQDKALLGELKAGDRVRFQADKVNGSYTVMAIERLP